MAAEDTVVMPDSLEGSADESDSADQTQETRVEEKSKGTDDEKATAAKSDADDAGKETDKTGKRIADTDKALKEKQRELHDLSMQIAAKKAVQEQLERERAESGKNGDGNDNPFAFLDDEERDADLDATPGKAVRRMLKDYTSKVVSLLQDRDSFLLKKVQETVDEATSPERAELRETIFELSGKKWFSALPKDAQVAAAKEWREVKASHSDHVRPHNASPGGTGRRTPSQKLTAKEEREAEAAAIARAVWGDKQDPDEDLYMFGKPKTEKQ